MTFSKAKVLTKQSISSCVQPSLRRPLRTNGHLLASFSFSDKCYEKVQFDWKVMPRIFSLGNSAMPQTGLNWSRSDFFAKVSDLHWGKLQLVQFLADQVLKC